MEINKSNSRGAKRCVVPGCAHLSSSGQGMFLWPKNAECGQMWTSAIKKIKPDFLGPGNHGSMYPTICGGHFSSSCFDSSTMLAKELGFKRLNKLLPDAIPTIFTSSMAIISPDRSPPAKVPRQRLDEVLENIVMTRDLVADEPDRDSDSASVIPLVKEASIRQTVSHKCTQTRMNYRSAGVQVRMHTGHSKGSQAKPCVSSAGTETPAPATKDATTQCFSQPRLLYPEVHVNEKDNDVEVQDDPSDPDYATEEESQSTGNSQNSSADENTTMPTMSQVLVFLSSLLTLFTHCQRCGEKAPGKVGRTMGTYVEIIQICKDCGFKRTWQNQPMISNTPAGNLILSAAILFAGASATKVIRIFKYMKCLVTSVRTFHNHQRRFLLPTVINVWLDHRTVLIEKIKANNLDGSLVVGGDGRCDSPGHCAKYGSYTIQELTMNKVLDVQLVQSNEVESSNHMEKEGLIRCMEFLTSQSLKIKIFVTDRHVQIVKWMSEHHQDVDHRFDVWHLAKSLKKKLVKISKEKRCAIVSEWLQSIINHLYWCAMTTPDGDGDMIGSKWVSLTRHILNQHDNHEGVFDTCSHGQLSVEESRRKKWLVEGSLPALKLNNVIKQKSFVRDVKKLSPCQQTYGLEVYHSILLLLLAAMHYNENSDRKDAVTREGNTQYRIKYPKSKKGGYVVHRVKTDPTYNYVNELMDVVLQRCRENAAEFVTYAPMPLTSQHQKPDKETAILQHRSRFTSAVFEL